MLSIRNQVQLIGHLGFDPTVKVINNNQLLSVNLATTDRYFSKGEWRDDTQWHRLVMWNKLAERAEKYLFKGSYVLIHGKLEHRSYEDSNGTVKYITEIKVNNFILLDKTAQENNKINSLVEEAYEKLEVDENEEELPF